MKRYIRKQYKLLICTFLLCGVYSIMNVGIAVLLQSIVDIATSKDLNNFINLSLIAGVYIIILSGVYYIYHRTINQLSRNIIIDLRNDLFTGILQKDYERYISNDSSVYISALINDINLLESSYLIPFINLIQNSLMFIFTIILLLKYGGMITVWLTFLLLIIMILPKKLGGIMQRKQIKLSNEMKSFTETIRDYLFGYEVIHNACIQNTIIHKFKDENMLVALRKFDRDNMIFISDSISCLLASFMQISIVFIGVFSIIKGSMTIGVVTALIQLCNMFTTPVSAIIQDLSEIKSAEPIVEKIEKFIQYTEKCDISHLNKIYSIRMENVYFKYPLKKLNTLEIQNLQIQQGKKYLITGKSGCGKSTLLKLFTGHFKQYEGNIFFNDIELRRINEKDIYQKIAIIDQNIFLFNTSIIDNITLGQEYSNSDIEYAIKMSGVDKFIDRISRGLNARIGENGRELSGGQRQRIAIARALIQKKEILILDESISSIDKQTRDDIENKILSISDIILINVSHELKEVSMNKYDEIIFIEDGKISEIGSYDELKCKRGEFQKYLTS